MEFWVDGLWACGVCCRSVAGGQADRLTIACVIYCAKQNTLCFFVRAAAVSHMLYINVVLDRLYRWCQLFIVSLCYPKAILGVANNSVC
jgi:hypothetical protein